MQPAGEVGKNKNDMKGVINDPLGQTHIVTPVANIVFCCFVFLILKSGDGRTDNMDENNYPYRPWLWVGRVDQKRCKLKYYLWHRFFVLTQEQQI